MTSEKIEILDVDEWWDVAAIFSKWRDYDGGLDISSAIEECRLKYDLIVKQD